MQAHDEIRIAPDGRVARRIPLPVAAEARERWEEWDYGWITFDWPDGDLTMQLLTEHEVSAWDIAFTKESDGTD